MADIDSMILAVLDRPMTTAEIISCLSRDYRADISMQKMHNHLDSLSRFGMIEKTVVGHGYHQWRPIG